MRLRLPHVSRLLLLDGHSLAYRAFYALPAENFSTRTGQFTNAVYGFTSMLINVLRDEEPTHVAVAFDVSRQTFRSEAYAEYKAGRSATPSEFTGQLPLMREILDALRIRYVELDGYEADDVIATLTARGWRRAWRCVICSGDRDCFQLVSRLGDHALPGAWRLRSLADDAGEGVGEVPRAARAVQRPRRAGGGVLRQPAGGAGSRPQDRGQVDRPVRRSGGHRRPRRPDHRPGRRRAAGAPRRGAAQSPAQPAGPRPAAGRHRRRGRAPAVGPRAGAPGVRRAGVQGAA